MKSKHPNQNAGRSPVSVRLTDDERSILKSEACGKSLSEHIRTRLFRTDAPKLAVETEQRISTLERQKLLAQILSELGKSTISAHLKELTELAQLGLLPDCNELCETLRRNEAELDELRLTVLRGLGLHPKSGGSK